MTLEFPGYIDSRAHPGHCSEHQGFVTGKSHAPQPGTRDRGQHASSGPKTDAEILIAGAGPTGLALAAELMRHGVMSEIVDRQLAGANTSRACVVHARTLEVLKPLGVTQHLLAQGVKVPIFRVRDRDRSLITIDFSEIPSPYPFTLMIPQNQVERKLPGRTRRRRCPAMRASPAPGVGVVHRGAGSVRRRIAGNENALADRLRRHAQRSS